ncbi:hypothetical protein PCANC_14315 [Puccinia coronata f. sp. avenae]|uniref:No apical meristem-associated C-terminal domain-containing protein n=1 Tax=Puccinia coronata f. sp. avenae TaxID=200324 RepID=A0A2N5VLD2_9BASI|nr:hypothetical protein PCANC_14315 [Puccinia coronata f. sp. avenae]
MSTPPVDPLLLEIKKPDDEDVQICESWLAVPQDPLNSTNQSGDTSWTRIVNANQSGASHNNQLSAALKLYCKTEGKPFTCLRCFNILVNAEKWNAYCADLELKNAATKKLASNADPPASVIDLSSEVIPSDATSKITVVPASSEPG